MIRTLALGLGLLGVVALAACSEDEPLEEAGESMQETVEEAGDAAQDAVDEVEDELDGQ